MASKLDTNSLDPKALKYVSQKLPISPAQILKTCELLFKEECTVPFIARYRKEVTGNLDEQQIRHIQESYEESLELEKRRISVMDAITKMDAMTAELKKALEKAETILQIEEIYAPYKSKKKTKAMIAKESGVLPLFEKIFNQDKTWESLQAEMNQLLTESAGKITDGADALSKVSDIAIELFSHHHDWKEKTRQTFWSSGQFESKLRKDGKEHDQEEKYKDFYEFTEPLSKLKEASASHRFLAMRRGMLQKVLSLSVSIDRDQAVKTGKSLVVRTHKNNTAFWQKVAEKAYDLYLQPSLDLEIKAELKKIADTAAIEIFGKNLKDLLLQPYLGAKAVMGIDPGVRTGCKIVLIDPTGKFLLDHVIYPFAPRNDVQGSREILTKLIEHFKVEYICIGNGTHGRETLEFIHEHVSIVKEKNVQTTLVSESGASIYSASEIAREEFPDKDVTVRGAISIARRFQDPLAELVKIDAKSIGVGQYQHDINQTQLKKSLDDVVESCVNYVGVDLNTASAPLLSYISGVGPAVAKNIVQFREKKGGFKKRQDLLDVPRLTPKVFEQAAGFMRIYAGENPLDKTFIHPERYPLLETWVKKHQLTLVQFVQSSELIQKFSEDKEVLEQIGSLTLKDIVQSLRAPSQDPRENFKNVEFAKGVHSMDDLVLGEWYNGVVTNITLFGAFVDIGIKENGLLHISQLADQFVKDPREVLKVGMEVKVRVIEIDKPRKRVALSRKKEGQVQRETPEKSARPSMGSDRAKSPRYESPKAPEKPRSSAFAALSGFKVQK
jgi:uncharacterized protein